MRDPATDCDMRSRLFLKAGDRRPRAERAERARAEPRRPVRAQAQAEPRREGRARQPRRGLAEKA